MVSPLKKNRFLFKTSHIPPHTRVLDDIEKELATLNRALSASSSVAQLILKKKEEEWKELWARQIAVHGLENIRHTLELSLKKNEDDEKERKRLIEKINEEIVSCDKQIEETNKEIEQVKQTNTGYYFGFGGGPDPAVLEKLTLKLSELQGAKQQAVDLLENVKLGLNSLHSIREQVFFIIHFLFIFGLV